jgi:adenylosuccinate synthase
MTNDKIVVGTLFGDEGKGTSVDYLASQERPVSVVRYGGGPQTAHNVVSPSGIHHTFAQFGSASLQEVPTTLSRFMLVNPFNLVTEGDMLFEKTGWNPFPDLLISENALLITPLHVWLNRKREEARGAAAHGSCGEGIGETRLFHIRHAEQAPFMGDLMTETLSELKEKLHFLRSYVEKEADAEWEGDINELFLEYQAMAEECFLNIVPDSRITERIQEGFTIFEGSQGILLDESYGLHPHTTWSSVTSEHAQLLLKEAGKPRGTVIGALRTYLTRHGFGPFPSEIQSTQENIDRFPEVHNQFGRYQGGWRRGYLDLPLLDYAIRANGGIDVFSLTHADLVTPHMPVVVSYKNWKEIPSDFFHRDRDKQEEITQHLMSLSLDDAEIEYIDSAEELITLLNERFQIPTQYLSSGKTYLDKETLF